MRAEYTSIVDHIHAREDEAFAVGDISLWPLPNGGLWMENKLGEGCAVSTEQVMQWFKEAF